MNMKFDVIFGEQRDVHKVYRRFCFPQINIALSIHVVHILNSISVSYLRFMRKNNVSHFLCPFSKLHVSDYQIP